MVVSSAGCLFTHFPVWSVKGGEENRLMEVNYSSAFLWL